MNKNEDFFKQKLIIMYYSFFVTTLVIKIREI